MLSQCLHFLKLVPTRENLSIRPPAPPPRPPPANSPPLPVSVSNLRGSEFPPGNEEGGAGWGRETRFGWAPSACASPPRTICAALREGVGWCLPDGLSTGAGRALEEVHAPLGGPQWLLCVLVAQGLFLGRSWSRRRTGTDTRLPRGRLSARVTSSLEGCGVYPGPPWPGKCRLRPGPVISGASRKWVCPISTNRLCR